MATSSRPLADLPSPTPEPTGNAERFAFLAFSALIVLGVIAVVVSFMRM